MYKCYDCGYIFDNPKAFSEDRTPGGVFEGGSFIERYEGCPECSGTFGKVVECDNCGEFTYENLINSTDIGSLCNDCYEDEYGDDI